MLTNIDCFVLQVAMRCMHFLQGFDQVEKPLFQLRHERAVGGILLNVRLQCADATPRWAFNVGYQVPFTYIPCALVLSYQLYMAVDAA